MSDDDIIKVKSRRRSILSSDKSSEDSDCEHGGKERTTVVVTTTTPRSSERLRKKAQQCHTVPKRKEKLEEICSERALTEENAENLSLSRRNLISDLVRGSSRYVTDKLQTFSSSDSSFSDFIDDSEESETHTVTTGHHSMRTRQNNNRRRQRKHVKTDILTDSDSDRDISKNISRKRRPKKHLNLSDEDSEEGRSDDSTEGLSNVKVNSVKKKKALVTSDEDDNQPVRSKRRTKSVQQKKKEELLCKIVEKRKSKTTKIYVKDDDSPSDVSTDTELDRVCCLHEDTEAMIKATLEEGDSDREFIVNEDDSENIFEFYDSLWITENNKQTDIITSEIVLSIQDMNNFKRVTVVCDSEESDNEELECIDPEMKLLYDVITQDNAVLLNDIIAPDPTLMEKFTTNKQTLLHLAAKKGCVKCTEYLVKAGCDRLALDSSNMTASVYAILYKHIECVKLLLQDVIDVHFLNKTLQDQYKMTVFHFAIYGQLIVKHSKPNQLSITMPQQCLLELFEFLFELDNWFCFTLLEKKDKNELTPLLAAVAFGKPECVTFLLNKGSHVTDFRFRNEGTLLHFAVDIFVNTTSEKIPHDSCISALLQSSQLLQVFIDTPDNLGFTPLMVAAESGNYACLEELLKYGASVSSKDKQGATSLHLAAASGHTECVKLLISNGHKVDCLDKWGWPPILYANFAAQESCVLALMKPNPKQIFVLGDLLRKADSEAAIERNYKVVKDVLMAIANQDVYYRVFNDFIRKNPSFLEENDDGLLHGTWRAILDFNNKKTWLKRKISSIKQNNSYRHIGSSCIFDVSRENIFQSTMSRFKKFSGSDFRNISFDIKFQNEEGVYLGPKREYFVGIFKDLVSSSYRLFHVVDNNQYSLLPYSFFNDSFKKEVMEKQQSVSKYRDNHEHNVEIIASLDKNQISDDQLIANLDLDDLPNTTDTQSSSQNVSVGEEKCHFHTSLSVEKQMHANLEYLEFFGKLIGTAICQNEFLNCHLSKPLVKQILGIKVIHPDDLSYMDNELHKNLVSYILEEESVEDLMLPCSFDVINPWNNQPCAVDIMTGDCEYLNNENKKKYVEMVSNYKLTLLFQKELDMLCEGLYQVIPKEFLSIFTADDFSLLINGVDKIDVDNWEINTIYGYHDTTDYDVSLQKEITWFWEVVRELNEGEKALLLKFSTGTPCVPAGGFAQLAEQFRIVVKGVFNKIPTASTCFNMLKLSIYDTKKDLKDKLLIAIRHGTEGFSFT